MDDGSVPSPTMEVEADDELPGVEDELSSMEEELPVEDDVSWLDEEGVFVEDDDELEDGPAVQLAKRSTKQAAAEIANGLRIRNLQNMINTN